MDDEKLPIPLSAIMVMPVPVASAVTSFLVWTIITVSEAQGGTRTALMLIPVAIVIVGGFVQHRYVRRAVAVGMIHPGGSPLVVSVATAVAAVIAIAVMVYLPGGPTSVRTPWNRNSIGFGSFLALVVIWLSACAALMVHHGSPSRER